METCGNAGNTLPQDLSHGASVLPDAPSIRFMSCAKDDRAALSIFILLNTCSQRSHFGAPSFCVAPFLVDFLCGMVFSGLGLEP